MARRRTEAAVRASQANGARSRGPVSLSGKAKSARNARKHGLFSPVEFDARVLSRADIELLDHLRNLGGGVWNANLLIREAHQVLVRLRRASVLIEDFNKDIDLILADKLTDLGVLGQRVEDVVRLSRYERRFRGRLDRLIRTAMKLDRDRACESLAN